MKRSIPFELRNLPWITILSVVVLVIVGLGMFSGVRAFELAAIWLLYGMLGFVLLSVLRFVWWVEHLP